MALGQLAFGFPNSVLVRFLKFSAKTPEEKHITTDGDLYHQIKFTLALFGSESTSNRFCEIVITFPV